MKKLYRNIIVLAVAGCFLAIGCIGKETTAKAANSAKPTPSPKAKNSTPAPKTTPKSSATPKTTKSSDKAKPPTPKTTTVSKPTTTPKPTPKPAAVEQIIVTATASRIRQEPKTNSAQLTSVKLGKILPVSEKNAAWYKVEYADGKSGWISKTLVRDYEADDRDDIYLQIANKYHKTKPIDFPTAIEVMEFLRTAQATVRKDNMKADIGLKRLRILNSMLKSIPFGKGEQSPYKNFLKVNEQESVYSEPSGEWFVRSESLWKLHDRYTETAVAEEIAWEAAKNPIPGECEGYINCQLYALRAMEGEYLNFYPNGRYAKQALQNVTASLGTMVADMKNKETFTPLGDISDRAEFNRFLTELRTIISKVPDVDKAKPLQQINQLGEGYK